MPIVIVVVSEHDKLGAFGNLLFQDALNDKSLGFSLAATISLQELAVLLSFSYSVRERQEMEASDKDGRKVLGVDSGEVVLGDAIVTRRSVATGAPLNRVVGANGCTPQIFGRINAGQQGHVLARCGIGSGEKVGTVGWVSDGYDEFLEDLTALYLDTIKL